MVEEESGEAGGDEKSGGLGYDDVSMNAVPASVTEEPSESGRRAGGLALLVIGVLVVVAVAVLAGRVLLNPHPGREAEERLQQRVSSELPEWRLGLVLEAGYNAGDRAWLRFAPSIGTASSQNERGERELVVPSEEEREKIREATRRAMEILVSERPGKDLYIDGYKGDDKIVEASYRHRSTLPRRGGERMLEIVVRVAGDPKEGMGAAYGQSGMTRTSD